LNIPQTDLDASQVQTRPGRVPLCWLNPPCRVHLAELRRQVHQHLLGHHRDTSRSTVIPVRTTRPQDGAFVSQETLAKMKPRDGTLGRQPAMPKPTSRPQDGAFVSQETLAKMKHRDGTLGRQPATPKPTSRPQDGAFVSQETLAKMKHRDGTLGRQPATPKPTSQLHENAFVSQVLLSKMNPESDCSAKKSTEGVDQTTQTHPT
jgi:hypothetical protein